MPESPLLLHTTSNPMSAKERTSMVSRLVREVPDNATLSNRVSSLNANDSSTSFTYVGNKMCNTS